jgi:Zn finger protein HypA/HybF involved in hydrogenase expression
LHESPVARELIKAAVKACEEQSGSGIKSMDIALGPDGGYTSESLAAHIEAQAGGTLAEGAEIVIELAETGGPNLKSISIEVA